MVDEKVLPQAMALGGGGGGSPLVRTLPVHVMHNGVAATYRINSAEITLAELDAALRNSAAGGAQYVVRISYEAGVPFGDVISVFNVCKKAGIERCGMVPLRRGEAL